MGAFISVILSKENTYTDDTFDYSDTSIEFKPSNENNNEFIIPINTTTTDWINFNNKRNYKDNGMDILG